MFDSWNNLCSLFSKQLIWSCPLIFRSGQKVAVSCVYIYMEPLMICTASIMMLWVNVRQTFTILYWHQQSHSALWKCSKHDFHNSVSLESNNDFVIKHTNESGKLKIVFFHFFCPQIFDIHLIFLCFNFSVLQFFSHIDSVQDSIITILTKNKISIIIILILDDTLFYQWGCSCLISHSQVSIYTSFDLNPNIF